MDYDRMRLEELASISEFLHGLDPEDWDQQSLCTSWRVRDVISHMCVGYTTPMGSMIRQLAGYRFNVPNASREVSIAFGTLHSPTEILAVFDSIHQDKVRKGIAHVIRSSEALVDHLTHHQDIRRPLGKPREMPEDRLVAALGVVPGLSGFVGAKKRVAGLRLVATDVPWTHGAGPEVRGPGEAILLAATGRPAALDDLEGDGMATLRARMAA